MPSTLYNPHVIFSRINTFWIKNKAWLGALVLVLILIASMGLRFYQLDAQSFWNDEGNSARLSERSLNLIIEGTASDIHPPLYYIILRGWREILGESEFGLRSFSAFMGFLTVATITSFTRLSARKKSFGFVLLAMFLAAINPALIYYSQETRMYALLALLAGLSTLVLYRWLTAENGFRWAAVYIVISTAGLYTHYFYPAVILFQNFIVIFYLLQAVPARIIGPWRFVRDPLRRKTLIQWIGMMGVTFFLYVPWLPIFLRQAGGRSGQRGSFSGFLWDSLRWLAFGETISSTSLLWPTIAAASLLIIGMVAGMRKSLGFMLGLIIPVLFMYAAGTVDPAFFKFMLVSVPFFILVSSRAIDIPGKLTRGLKRLFSSAILIALLIVFLVGTAVSLRNLYFDPAYARADYRMMASRIMEDGRLNPGIILNAPNQWEVFTYYYHDTTSVYPLPKGQPDPEIVESQLAEIISKHDRIYGIFWGEEQRDPQNIVEKWLDANTFKTSEEWVGDVRFIIYTVPREMPSEIKSSGEVQFGDSIMLEGYALQNDTVSPGGVLNVTLFWQTSEPLQERYKIFMHLVDSNGMIVSQRDDEPAGGQQPTISWKPGEIVKDNYGLLIPSGLAPGNYNIIIGLYDLSDPNSRLPVYNNGQPSDSFLLAPVSVK